MQIQDGQIHALINQKDGMVRFLEDPEQYKTSEMIEVMDSVIQRYVYEPNTLLPRNQIGRGFNYLAGILESKQALCLYDFQDYRAVEESHSHG